MQWLVKDTICVEINGAADAAAAAAAIVTIYLSENAMDVCEFHIFSSFWHFAIESSSTFVSLLSVSLTSSAVSEKDSKKYVIRV